MGDVLRERWRAWSAHVEFEVPWVSQAKVPRRHQALSFRSEVLAGDPDLVSPAQ